MMGLPYILNLYFTELFGLDTSHTVCVRVCVELLVKKIKNIYYVHQVIKTKKYLN